MSALAKRLERERSIERFDPWNFGIPALDEVVKGIRPGFVNLIIARPHVGKTLLTLAGIRNNPEVPTLFVSADDDPDVVVRKMMQYDGVVADGWKATKQQMSRYVQDNYPSLDVVDNVTWGPVPYNGAMSLSDAVDRFTDDFGDPPGLIVYDYLGIDNSDYSKTMEIASWQKHMVREMPMPVLIIAQSNRQSARTVKEGDEHVRRGFRMEDLAFGGEQLAGLMMGLTPWNYMIGGAPRRCIEVDVVKNKAVFDGSGITDPKEPIVLCHSGGRLVDRATAHNEWYYGTQLQEEMARDFAP